MMMSFVRSRNTTGNDACKALAKVSSENQLFDASALIFICNVFGLGQ